MLERDSLPPEELEELQELRAKDKRTFSVNLDKRVGSIIGVVLSVISAYGGWQLVTKAQLDERTAEIKAEAKAERKTLKDVVVKVSGKVGTNSTTILAVQKVQHQDIAIREARRVIGESIKCRRGDNGCEDKQDNERERVRRENMKRLKAGDSPCADLACD